MKPNESIEVLNGTAVLTMSQDGKTTKLVLKPGTLPLQSINPTVTDLDKEGLKIQAANR